MRLARGCRGSWEPWGYRVPRHSGGVWLRWPGAPGRSGGPRGLRGVEGGANGAKGSPGATRVGDQETRRPGEHGDQGSPGKTGDPERRHRPRRGKTRYPGSKNPRGAWDPDREAQSRPRTTPAPADSLSDIAGLRLAISVQRSQPVPHLPRCAHGFPDRRRSADPRPRRGTSNHHRRGRLSNMGGAQAPSDRIPGVGDATRAGSVAAVLTSATPGSRGRLCGDASCPCQFQIPRGAAVGVLWCNMRQFGSLRVYHIPTRPSRCRTLLHCSCNVNYWRARGRPPRWRRTSAFTVPCASAKSPLLGQTAG